MINVKEIIVEEKSETSIIMLGGSSAKIEKWPCNPDRDALVLIATIDCSGLQDIFEHGCVPAHGILNVFSTYSENEYFLENVTYSGDPAELESIQSGYTLVTFSNSDLNVSSIAKGHSIPKVGTRIIDKAISKDDFPVFSMLSYEVPNGLTIPPEVLAEYDFFMQIYSADFPDPYKDIFYLTDAVGCLLLKKDKSGQGIFFIHTA